MKTSTLIIGGVIVGAGAWWFLRRRRATASVISTATQVAGPSSGAAAPPPGGVIRTPVAGPLPINAADAVKRGASPPTTATAPQVTGTRNLRAAGLR